MVRRILVAVGLFIGVTAFITGAGAVAQPGGKIGPGQPFFGLVNNQDGFPAPAPIKVACNAALALGHPVAGQTFEVFEGPHFDGTTGYTGSNTTGIAAFFGLPPPAPVTIPPATSRVTFGHYGVVKAIPTSILVPCAGTGDVYFVPWPMSPPTSKPAVMPVTFQFTGCSGPGPGICAAPIKDD